MTIRRRHLDKFVQEICLNLCGIVLDVGGEKETSRSKVSLQNASASVLTFNIDYKAKPDVIGDALSLPFKRSSFDQVLILETIEHVADPDRCLAECVRVLKEEGKLFLTMPFLYQVHGDPYDFQRWTADKLELELRKHNFSEISVVPMGGLLAVMHDLMHSYAHRNNPKKLSFAGLMRWVIRNTAGLIYLLDNSLIQHTDKITTGWQVSARKKRKA